MHCNLRPPEPWQPFPASVTTHAKLDVAEPVHWRIIAFWGLIHCFTLWSWLCCCDLDLWPRTFAAYHLWRDDLNTVEQSAAELVRFHCLTLWPWTCFKCCAWVWDNFPQVWPSTIYPCLNYRVFWCWYVMSSCDFDLWPVDLDICGTSSGIWSKSIRAKLSNARLNYW